ncbi:hypothetical protein NCC49_004824 [Naganishia albida]|nr:hypothetical protein NCC49_004824 [Naganishia albida]
MSTLEPNFSVKMPQLAVSPFEFEPDALRLVDGYFPTMEGDDAFVDVDLDEDSDRDRRVKDFKLNTHGFEGSRNKNDMPCIHDELESLAKGSSVLENYQSQVTLLPTPLLG